MTGQAAPPARRWLLVVLALLAGPWLGQGPAAAYTVTVDPQSGPVGTTVSVTLTDFGAGCVVFFDGEPVAGARDCQDATTLVFEVPPTAAGNHTILAEGIVLEGTAPSQSFTFRVTATPTTTAPAPTTPPISSAPVSATENNVVVGAVGAPTTVARTATTGSTASTTPQPTTTGPPNSTSVAGVLTGASTTGTGQGIGAVCPPRQVALKRFAVAPLRGRPGAKVTGTTTYGLVGTCTEVRTLRVILDGKTVPGEPPVAGTSGSFEMSIPRDAEAGPHTLALVADDDPSVELATIAFRVEEAKASILPIAGLAAAGVALLLLVLLMVRRRRRRGRRARRADRGRPTDDGWADDGFDGDDGGGWGGTLEVPVVADGSASPDVDVPTAPAILVEDHPTMPVVPLVVAGGRHGSFYLLERQNPHAPRQANGKRGWYRDGRTQPIRGIVVDTVEAHTAGAAASELAMGETPASAHVLVDVDGALDLLPDDVVAVHQPEHDEAILVLLLAGLGQEPSVDEAVFGHAGRWAEAKMREHAIPARLVTGVEFEAGDLGLLSGDTTFLWHRMVTLTDPPPATAMADETADSKPEDDEPVPVPEATVAAPAPVSETPDAPPPVGHRPAWEPRPIPEAPSIGPRPVWGAPLVQAGTVSESPVASALPTSEPPDAERPVWAPRPMPVDAATVPESPVPESVAEPLPSSERRVSESSVSEAPIGEAPDSAPLPVEVAPVETAAAVGAAVPTHESTEGEGLEPSRPANGAPAPSLPRPRRPLPTPDELIAQVSAEPSYYLLEHQNAHATLRANGKHGWYYPTRYGGIRAVVLHTLPGGTADAVAAHLASVDQPEAAHAVVDPDVIVDLLPDEATALHGVRSSSAAIDLALAYDPSAWGTDPAREEALLVRAATWAGIRAVRHGIAVRRITVEQWHDGQAGIAANRDFDPGPGFPWERFLQLTAWVAGRVASGAMSNS